MAIARRDHLLSRGKLADRANAFLAKAWEKEWLPPPDLDPEALWDVAARPLGDRAKIAEAGTRSPQEIADFRLRLERLLESVRDEANLNPLGQAMAYGQLVRAIRTRLMLGEYWVNTAIPRDAQAMAPPIFIIGHMRSGTTRLHTLFASDPAHSCTRYCDAWRPVPGNLTARQIKGSLDLVMLEALNPWLQSIHPMKSGRVEEELAWLAISLNHSLYESQWHIPSYSGFSEARDPMPVYTELKRILITDALHRGIARKPRVMKAPQFSEDLATLLELFPDARIVVAERKREDVLRSAVSLVANQMAIQSDTCDLEAITALYEHKITLRDERREHALSRFNGPVTRLRFDDLSHDWESEIARAYAELGIELTRKARAAMTEAMQSSRSSAHHRHSAQLMHFAKQS